MTQIPTLCPSCSTPLQLTRLSCPSCDAQLEGDFTLPALLRLPPDDLAFVTEFVRASGSLKEMAKLRKQSYPTIRNRLNDIIARLESDGVTKDQQRNAILDAIAKGELSVAEAARKLKEIGS